MSDQKYTLEELGTDMVWVKKILGNHLQHHEATDKTRQQQTWALVLALIGSIITLFITLITG